MKNLNRVKIWSVVSGNTCRSPIAEAVFRQYVKENDLEEFWEVDSAALFGYHEGKNINAKSIEVIEKNGITDYHHVARTVSFYIKMFKSP